MSGLYNQAGRKVIRNNSASIELWHLGNRKSKNTQFGTMCLLLHNKGLLPPPAQFSPLLCVSHLQSGEVNTMIMIPNGLTCTMALNDVKVRSWGIQEPPSPCQAAEIPAWLTGRHLISTQGWQCHLYLQCRQLPGSSSVPEVAMSGWKGFKAIWSSPEESW